MKRVYLAAALAAGLVACGDGNPFTTVTTPDPTADPSTTNEQFIFDTSKNLIANEFTFNAATNTIRINNLPFDGNSSSGGSFNAAGVVLPNGAQVYANTPGTGEDQYYAVVLQSGTTTALVGAVGTQVYEDFGYGGAYASRPSSALPTARPATYRYNGTYAGIRVLAGEGNDIQFVNGDARIDVDLQNIEAGGSMRGFIVNRVARDETNTVIGNLRPIELVIGAIDSTNNSSNGVARNTNGTSPNTPAQTGTWEGYFSGPGGAEVVGLLVIEGTLPTGPSPANPAIPPDPSQNATNGVTGREIGGFITTQVP